MSAIKVIYGSTTGNTEDAAETIAQGLNAELVEVSSASAEDFGTELTIFGCSTWGSGDLQDDWDASTFIIEDCDLSGKTVALFGFGDGYNYADTFVGAIGTLYEQVVKSGARVIGFCETAGYEYDESTAIHEGKFVGLPLDEDNQSKLTEGRIEKWLTQLQSEL